jgi:hypothetical protein
MTARVISRIVSSFNVNAKLFRLPGNRSSRLDVYKLGLEVYFVSFGLDSINSSSFHRHAVHHAIQFGPYRH